MSIIFHTAPFEVVVKFETQNRFLQAEDTELWRKRQHPVLTRHRERLRFWERSKADSRHSTSSLRLRSGLAWQAEDAEFWRKTKTGC